MHSDLYSFKAATNKLDSKISIAGFDKTYIYKSPNTKYQQFTNAFVYHFIVENENLIPSRLYICDTAAKESTVLSQKTNIPKITISSSHAVTAILTEKEIWNNALAQKWAACSIEAAETKIKELEQSKCHSKKVKALEKQQEVVWYNKYGRPSYLLQNSDLLEHIHNSIEYGSANTQRCKEAIKVAVAEVSCDEIKYHSDGYYCLASVKSIRQFVQTFADLSVIISQDDKMKIGLGIAAVGRTFHILQSSSQPVQLPDHDFVHESSQKLIPSLIGTSSITHMKDLFSLVLDNQYSEILKINSEIKLIWVLLVDRQSKYNSVKRGMATLS
ncbi:16336_t:CDS:2, partial [Cetraspora pellucida]